MLMAGGAPVTRDGNIIDGGGHKIAVAEACNGIRCLLTLRFVAVVFAYFVRRETMDANGPACGCHPSRDPGQRNESSGHRFRADARCGRAAHFLRLSRFVLCVAMLAIVRRLLNAAYARQHA